MKIGYIAGLLTTCSALALSTYAAAEDNKPDNQGDVVVVTATKRSESVNKVAMSIAAVSGDNLSNAGVKSANDLSKVVTGFVYTPSAYSAPVYSIRGVGFYDYAVGSTPAVTVYQNEVPLPFASMSRGAGFDLTRVEVLKGPQGLLFGSNSTGGAVSYISAQPTNETSIGLDLSAGSFGSYEIGGFASGSLSENVRARATLHHEGSDTWQQSTTRNDALGKRDFTQYRISIDTDFNDKFSGKFALNGFVDKSDSQAAQLIQVNPLIPPFVDSRLATLPIVGSDARKADWTPGFNPSRDDKQIQGIARFDYKFANDITLTSLTSYSHYEQDDLVDPDATALAIDDTKGIGDVKAFFQELRFSGNFGNDNRWIVGVNYEDNKVSETQTLNSSDASGFRFFNLIFGIPTPDWTPVSSRQHFNNIGAFANVDYNLTENITTHAGLRYTKTKDDFVGCTGDSANKSLGVGLGIILGAPNPANFITGQCSQLNANLVPEATSDSLEEDNISWRIGLDYKPNSSSLLYANISRGYKAGAFPLLPATSYAQYTPVTQEELTAYEAGFKTSLLGRKLQINGALFYYDYKDKQVLGSVVLTPDIFGPLNRLVNIPKSTVKGGELQLTARPISGLNINAGVTYVDSEIGDFSNFDPYGVVKNFNGETFPNTPKWQYSLAADYEFAINEKINAFMGANLSARTKTNAALGNNPILQIDGYSLLDLRAGLASSDDSWRVTLWGRNVTDEYYWTNAYKLADVTARFAGMPATYGISLSIRK